MLRANIAALLLLLLPLAGPAAAGVQDAMERLPRDVKPTFQSIHLNLDPSQKKYTGTVRIELTVAGEQKALAFHAQSMSLTRARLEGTKGTTPLATHEERDGLVRAVREDGAPVAPGSYALLLDFTNDFDERATSLYRLMVDGEWYAFSQFEAIDARAAFPCFDEPSFKFPYQITVTSPANLSVVTNTPIERERTEGDRRTIVFARTKPLPSYLLALAVGPLEFTPVPGTSIPTRIVTVKGKRHLTGAAVQTTPPLLAALETYFGRRYPYEKLDILAVPEYTYGAMENPGAITYTDQAILFDQASMSIGQRRTLVRYTAHELAHMWFGDLVTMEWWNDLWLNESFAEWLGNKISDQVYPELETNVSRLGETQRAYAADANLTARPIRQEVKSAGALMQSADALMYQKGEMVLGMIEQWLGPDVFRRGIIAYLKKHEWGSAVEDDLWSALAEVSGRDVGAVGATFFTQPGIPLVRVERLEGSRVRVRQSRFLTYGLRDSVARRWRIPISFKYPTARGVITHTALLTAEEEVLSLPGLEARDVWIHPNAEETGYYRWTLPSESMARLANHSVDVLTPRERFGFLLNANALLTGGDLSGVDYLRLLEASGHDPHPAVLRAVADGVATAYGYFVTGDIKESFAAFVRRTLEPALDRIGLEPVSDESASTSSLRPSLFGALAEWGDRTDLRAFARQATKDYLHGGTVDPSMIGEVLRVAALDGDAALFDALQERFEKGGVPSERGRILAALGSFQSPELRARALAYNLSGPLKPQEHYAIPRAMGRVPEYEDEIWAYAQDNYAKITGMLPPFYLIYYPWMAAGCSAARLEEARAFFADEAHSPPGTETELKKVDAAVTQCIGLREREGAAVGDYLRARITAP